MRFLWAIFLVVFSTSLFASTAGTVTDLKGAVVISKGMRADANITEPAEINASIGAVLYAGDLVVTKEKNAVAILELSDGARVTVGGNSQFLLEEYSLEESRASLELVTGTLRVITGKIGKVAPKQFVLKTRTATMGVRGTDFVAVLAEDLTLKSACVDGAISVSNEFGEQIVEAGNMTTTIVGSAPSVPVSIPAGFLGGLGLGFTADLVPTIDSEPTEQSDLIVVEQKASDLNVSDLNSSDLNTTAVVVEPPAVELSRVKEVAFIRYKGDLIVSDMVKTDRGETLEFSAGQHSLKQLELNTPFIYTTVDVMDGIKLDPDSKIIIAEYEKDTLILVLEGGVTAWDVHATEKELLDSKGNKRDYTKKELNYYFDLLKLPNEERYLPKPKIYEF